MKTHKWRYVQLEENNFRFECEQPGCKAAYYRGEVKGWVYKDRDGNIAENEMTPLLMTAS